MNDKYEIAKKLAAITGKPIEEFYSEDMGHMAKTGLTPHVNKTGTQPSTKNPMETSTRDDCDNQETLEFQKMFKGSGIVNDFIMDGRTMTRKEYLKYAKGLDYEALFEHPLHFKMFRAEGQTEAFYHRWTNKFPRKEDECEE